MPSEFLFNHRFVYLAGGGEAQSQSTEGEQTHEAANKIDLKKNPDAQKYATEIKYEAQQKGATIIEHSRDEAPNVTKMTLDELDTEAKVHPESVLGSINQLDRFTNEPKFQEIIKEAAFQAANNNPSAAVVLDAGFKGKDYHAKVLIIAFNNLVDPNNPLADPRMVIGYAEEKIGKSLAKPLIEKAMKLVSEKYYHYLK